jgi:phage tail-like protein
MNPLASAQRLDPYKNFKFLLKYDGRYVYGGNQATGLTLSPATVDYRAGNDPLTSPRKLPGRTKYSPITLQRGVTLDQGFHNWASQVSRFGANDGSQVPPANFRKNLFLEIYDDRGHWITSYQITRSWVSGYKALPNLSSNSNSVAIEELEIEHEGLVLAPVHR